MESKHDPTAARAKLKELMAEARFHPHPAQQQSLFKNVNWNARANRWQVHIGVQGTLTTLGVFKFEDQEAAARTADQARWWLQDFLPRAPRYNFLDEIPPIDEPSPKVLLIRKALTEAGCVKNAPHHPEFKAPEQAAAHPRCQICSGAFVTLDPDGLCIECARNEADAAAFLAAEAAARTNLQPQSN